MAKRAVRHGTSTGTAKHGPAKHGTMRHSRLAVPCLSVPPCRGAGPGTALLGLSRAVPCHWARQPSSARADTGTTSDQTPQTDKNIRDKFIISNTSNRSEYQTPQTLHHLNLKLQVQRTYQRLKVTCSQRIDINLISETHRSHNHTNTGKDNKITFYSEL